LGGSSSGVQKKFRFNSGLFTCSNLFSSCLEAYEKKISGVAGGGCWVLCVRLQFIMTTPYNLYGECSRMREGIL